MSEYASHNDASLAVFEWNHDKIKELCGIIEKNKSILEEYKDEYSGIKQKIQEAFVSENSDNMVSIIDVDIENYTKLLEEMSNMITALTKASKDYSEGENNSIRKINSISDGMAELKFSQ